MVTDSWAFTKPQIELLPAASNGLNPSRLRPLSSAERHPRVTEIPRKR
jgi:hypothetical protein